MRETCRNLLRAALAVAAFGCLFGERALAQASVAPTPKAVIYPGDLIGAEMLTDAPFDPEQNSGPFALSRSDLTGKMAKRTLLPGQPIPLRAIGVPRAVRNGAEVKLIYIDGDLTIVTSGSALQDGVIGDVVKCRNNDSGVTVSGQVQPDGAVRVNGG